MNNKILNILYQPYKWLFFLPFAMLNTLFFAIIAVLLSSLISERTGSYWGGTIWSKLNGLLTPMLVKVYGKENIHKGQSYVIISNHQSLFDILALVTTLGIQFR